MVSRFHRIVTRLLPKWAKGTLAPCIKALRVSSMMFGRPAPMCSGMSAWTKIICLVGRHEGIMFALDNYTIQLFEQVEIYTSLCSVIHLWYQIS